MYRDINMGKKIQFRITRNIVILTALFLVSGCLEENLIYPEIISGNTFKLPERWSGKYISFVEVYSTSEDPSALLEPVWTLKVTEQVPADKVIFVAGIIPHGFEQTFPEPPGKFSPEEGKQYFIKIVIGPTDSNMISVLKPWRASAVPGIKTPDDVQPYVHQESKMEFPRYVGLFSKGDVTLYDNTGKDISVEYIQRALKCIVTVYIYPATDSLNRPADMKLHFDQIEQTIKKSYEEVSVISRGETVLEQDGSIYHGLHSAFAMLRKSSLGNVRVFSDLYLFRHGRWFIKYRFTYPRSSRRVIEDQIDQFMESLTWPGFDNPI